MLRFFRRIRQNLLAENRIRKYLAYAAGEVILVVIGILIALQLNNLNEERKLRIQEKELLVSLQDELRYNLVEIKRAREVNQNNIKGTGELISVFAPELNKELTDLELSALLAKSLQERTEFQPSLNIVGSNRLDLLSNARLRNELLTIITKVGHLWDAEKTVTEIRWECTLVLLEEGNMRHSIDYLMDTSAWYSTPDSAFENTNRELLNSRQLENKLVLFLATSLNSEEEHLKPLNDKFDSIAQMLEQELKRFD